MQDAAYVLYTVFTALFKFIFNVGMTYSKNIPPEQKIYVAEVITYVLDNLPIH